MLGLYAFGLRGVWRPVFLVTAVLSLYLNIFVGVVQAFQKIGPLTALAPTQSETPFVIAQTAVLVLAIIVCWLALRRFRGGDMSAA